MAVVENHLISNEATPDRVANRIGEEIEHTINYINIYSNSRNYSRNERSAYFESMPIVNDELIWNNDEVDELSDCTNSSAEAP